MRSSPQLLALADYLSGEFDNRQQALAEPVWYVHLRLWHRPVALLAQDSITLFAEQANIVNLERPYRQRIMRLMEGNNPDGSLLVQYYMLKDPTALSGAGRNPALLDNLTDDQIDILPGCVLNVKQRTLADQSYHFTASPPPETRCCFTYLGNTVEVALSFEANKDEFLSYDKGIDSETGKPTWGAILGPYRYTKRQ
ncbi:chromophore lyase CpcT/CpeT [Aetokthonos hydrillicola Thurmond2011]|jgi:hypothetical protein|uniref:Chromophore lyase CpcT/CpeT n=1 Tax=Aetokthonos hydrillicola Thurmond2011 TaxID=2712845 RepID=A0AAP5MAE0_9CYAN|nr:chromophore lyase CpcT/CpeT [Aetokthonos hydrillicola]MBO3458862.1 chorismate mutase [Aetokthonos hydrillicola CCALA 1050]MBW4587290.1 chromophore lyase CpcT/CpeT [Aetokthonos hydrillicola CCALA 1050]MDR9896687.1 chromophore lyase CpcT/CpeT [Aetokthonos hydrillicola Thurmond2011]